MITKNHTKWGHTWFDQKNDQNINSQLVFNPFIRIGFEGSKYCFKIDGIFSAFSSI
jgi:hypothetical protein